MDVYRHQKSYIKRMKERGHVKATVWIPDGMQRALRRVATKMRQEHERIPNRYDEE